MLKQLGISEGEGRAFEALEGDKYKLKAKSPLPKPAICIPRFEETELAEASTGSNEKVAPSTPVQTEAELADLVEEIGRAGDKVRSLKSSGAPKDEISAAVEVLLGLKAKLPAGHELNQKPMKKTKQKASAA